MDLKHEDKSNIGILQEEAKQINNEVEEKKRQSDGFSDQQLADQIVQERPEDLTGKIEKFADIAKEKIQREVIGQKAPDTERDDEPQAKPLELITTEAQIGKKSKVKMGWLEKIRQNKDFRDAGITDKETADLVRAVINFIVENVSTTEYHSVTVPQKRVALTVVQFKKKGWNLYGSRNNEQQETLQDLDFERSVKSNSKVSNSDLQCHVLKIVRQLPDPVRILNILNNVTTLDKEVITGYKSENIIRIAKNPRNIEVLEVLEKAGIKIKLTNINTTSLASRSEDFGDALDGIELNEQVLEQARKISKILANNISESQLCDLFHVANSPGSVELLNLLLRIMPNVRNRGGLLGGINYLEQNGLTDKVIFALENGITVPGLSEREIFSDHTSEYGKKHVVDYFSTGGIEAAEQDSELAIFIRIVGRFDSELTMDNINELYTNYEADRVIAIMEAISQAQIFTIGYKHMDTYKYLLANPVVLSTLLDDDFIAFTNDIVEQGSVKKNLVEIVGSYSHNPSALFYVFQDSELSDRVRSEAGMKAIVNYGGLPENIDGYKELMKVTESSEGLNLIGELRDLGIYVNLDSKLEKNLEGLLSDEKTLGNISEKYFREFVEAVKKDSYIHLVLGKQEFSNLVSFYQDKELLDELMKPENLVFLKSMLYGNICTCPPNRLKLILSLDQSTRDLCLKLKEAYGFSLTPHNFNVNTIDKLKALQSDEEKVAKLFDPERQEALKNYLGINKIFEASEHLDVPIPVINFLTGFKNMRWGERGHFTEQYGGENNYQKLLSLLNDNEDLLPTLTAVLSAFQSQDFIWIDSVEKLISLINHLSKFPDTSLINASKISILKKIKEKYHSRFDESADSLEMLEQIPEDAFERLRLVGEKTKINLEERYAPNKVIVILTSKQEAICEIADVLLREGVEIMGSNPSGINITYLEAFLREPEQSVLKYIMLFGTAPFRFDIIHGSAVSLAVHKDTTKEELDNLIKKYPFEGDNFALAYFCDSVNATHKINEISAFFESPEVNKIIAENPEEIDRFENLYDAGLFESVKLAKSLGENIGNREAVLSYITRVESQENNLSWFLLSEQVLIMVIKFPEKIENIFRLAKHADQSNANYALANIDLLSAINDQILSKSIELARNLTELGGAPKDFLSKLAENQELIDRFSHLAEIARSSNKGKRRLLVNPQIIDFISENEDSIDQLKDLEIPEDERVVDLCLPKISKILAISKEKRGAYLTIILRLADTPSQEIKLLINEILDQILKTDHPDEAYEAIESVFIKNNLPSIGKIFKVFSVLHSPKLLRSKSFKSPVLNKLKPEQSQRSGEVFYAVIFRDLLKCHIFSGNRSLKEYLEVLEGSGEIFDKLESKTDLTAVETEKAQKVLTRLQAVYENSQLGERQIIKGNHLEFGENLEDMFYQLKQSLMVREGQSINDRLAEMFLKPLGYKNFSEALLEMRETKKVADTRNRGIVETSEGQLNCGPGDFIKGLNNVAYLPTILQNGSVAKEFLGGSANSDGTPLDTDVSRVRESDGQNFQEMLQNSMAASFGPIFCVFRDRGQFDLTTSENSKYNRDKYEIFSCGGDQHFGIRTGIPSTEIDFLVLDTEQYNMNEDIPEIFFEIAQNGFYIPVTDKTGKVIFTPVMYDRYRRIFNGLERFDGDEFIFIPTDRDSNEFKEINRIKDNLETVRAKTQLINHKIISKINDVLDEFGIKRRNLDKLERGILGAEIYNTGSTGRHTNRSDDFDFDFTLRLDKQDMSKATLVSDKLREILRPQKDNSNSGNNFEQLRFVNASVDDRLVDIDIAIVSKTEIKTFSTNEAVEERLNWIQKNIGEEAYEEVIANIVLAKEILTVEHAYKRFEDGGLGGIGVENWILQNNGNLQKAMTSFWESCHDETNRIIPFDQFKQDYWIIDPGINLRPGINPDIHSHDNFTARMRSEGYLKMVEAVGSYLELM